MNEQTLDRALANFSLGLGLAELLAPRHVARLIGLEPGHEGTLRALGLREIGAGLALMQKQRELSLWSRVAGDVMDLALLGRALGEGRGDRRRLRAAMVAVAGVTVLDVVAVALSRRSYTEPGWRVAHPGGYRSGLAAPQEPAAPDPIGAETIPTPGEL